MKALVKVALTVCVLTLIEGAEAPAQQNAPVQRITAAAAAFLQTLDPGQRQRVMFAFDDATQRARWSNLPTGVVGRAGISLREMTPTQRDAAMALLAVVLSPRGLEKVNSIRQADDVFKEGEATNGPRGGRGRAGGLPRGGGPPRGGAPPEGPGGRGPSGPNDMFGADLYFISFLGQPSTTAPWMLQFGGHHLALNITIAGSAGILTPTLTGAQPAMFEVQGRTIRPLGRESDKALALVQSLDDAQRKRAVLTYRVADLVLGPGQDGKTIQPEGLEVASMTDAQRALLLDLVGEWTGIIDDAHAATRTAQLKADLANTWFAWSGPTDGQAGKNITAYYRVQGPHVAIEYAPQNDQPANHVHTMYRDPTNDYARALLNK
jgi:Protein of unknown function (DUF3500)